MFPSVEFSELSRTQTPTSTDVSGKMEFSDFLNIFLFNTNWNAGALVRALKEGWIAGAGLDVFPEEPPPSTHPIFDCTNVVMTAHTSGWSPDRQTRLIDLQAENLRRYAMGAPLLNIVDKKAGY
mgnify:CR=1 FL=1